jgi:hypothetical protein
MRFDICLLSILATVIDYNRAHSRFQDWSGTYYVVPPNFDETEEELEPARDHRILDNDGYCAPPRKDFATSLNETDHNNFFTPPYSGDCKRQIRIWSHEAFSFPC